MVNKFIDYFIVLIFDYCTTHRDCFMRFIKSTLLLLLLLLLLSLLLFLTYYNMHQINGKFLNSVTQAIRVRLSFQCFRVSSDIILHNYQKGTIDPTAPRLKITTIKADLKPYTAPLTILNESSLQTSFSK